MSVSLVFDMDSLAIVGNCVRVAVDDAPEDRSRPVRTPIVAHIPIGKHNHALRFNSFLLQILRHTGRSGAPTTRRSGVANNVSHVGIPILLVRCHLAVPVQQVDLLGAKLLGDTLDLGQEVRQFTHANGA